MSDGFSEEIDGILSDEKTSSRTNEAAEKIQCGEPEDDNYRPPNEPPESFDIHC